MDKKTFIDQFVKAAHAGMADVEALYDAVTASVPASPAPALLPFNLTRALAGAKVVTRDGREVNQVTKFETGASQPVVAVVGKELLQFGIGGNFLLSSVMSEYDLFLLPETVTGWVNVYPAPGTLSGMRLGTQIIHVTEMDAKSYADPDCIATIPISFTK